MAADTSQQSSTESHMRTHNKDYAKFTKLLKYAVIVVAIVAAIVIYIISN